MSLRLRLLVFTAVLVAAVLAASLSLIYADVRDQIQEQQQQALQISLTSFRASLAHRFERLHLLGGILESEPGFRTILRRTDFATLHDHVSNVVIPDYGLDLLVLTGPEGSLVYDSSLHGPPSGGLEQPFLEQCLKETRSVSAFWLRGGKLYQVVATPFFDGDALSGVAVLGLELGAEHSRRLHEDTTSDVLLLAEDGLVLGSTFPADVEPEQLDVPPGQGRTVRLGRDQFELIGAALDPEVRAPVHLVLGQNTHKRLQFLEESRRELYLIGFLALALALAASYPLLGRIANPLEQMQRAREELQAVVRANQDGLVATDASGRVRLANPAAAVALGKPLSELLDRPLSDLLPDEVAVALAGDRGARRVERVAMEREGYRFELIHTRLRVGQEAAGGLLVLRDVTTGRAEQARQRLLFARLAAALQAQDPSRTDLWRRNLGFLADPPEVRPAALDWEALLARLDRPGLELPSTPLPPVEADPGHLELALRNLLDNALKAAPETGACLRVEQQGGAVTFSVVDPGPGPAPDLHTAILTGPLPRPSAPDWPPGLGLGLAVATRCLEAMAAELRLDTPESGGCRFFFTLPCGLDTAETGA